MSSPLQPLTFLSCSLHFPTTVLQGSHSPSVGPWSSSVSSTSSTWKCIRNADSQAHPRPSRSEVLGVGPAVCAFTRLLGGPDACLSLRAATAGRDEKLRQGPLCLHPPWEQSMGTARVTGMWYGPLGESRVDPLGDSFSIPTGSSPTSLC